MSQDRSFLRLIRSFPTSIRTGIPPTATVKSKDFVYLLPNGVYLAITNTIDGISFNEEYQAHLVDDCGELVYDITPNITIVEFTDRNGVNQIVFEILNIGKTYHKPLYLKLFKGYDNNIIDAWYSTALMLSDCEATIRFDWKSIGYDNESEIDYSRSDFMQSIDIKGFYSDIEDDVTKKQYDTALNGLRLGYGRRRFEQDIFTIEYTDINTYRNLDVLLSADLVYLNGVRITNAQLEKEERLGNSNFFRAKLTVSFNQKDTYIAGLQITPAFALVAKYPDTAYTPDNIQNIISATFNKPISLADGNIQLLFGGAVIETFTVEDITVEGNTLSMPYDFTELGFYAVIISQGLVVSGGEVFEGVSWDFSIRNGDYSAIHYNSPSYLTQ